MALWEQARLADKEAAEREAARLKADNLQLAARLVEMKESEMQRMEDTNRMCEQMVCRLISAHLPPSKHSHSCFSARNFSKCKRWVLSG